MKGCCLNCGQPLSGRQSKYCSRVCKNRCLNQALQSYGAQQDRGPIVVRIDSSSTISVKGRVLEAGAVQANLEREKAEKPTSPLIVAAHPDANTEAMVTISDAARAVGIESVNVATEAQ